MLPGPGSQGPTRIGNYVVVRELARGGMGVVYVARQPALDREVALKLLLGGDATRFKRMAQEAKAVARLQHPNIVAVHEFGLEQGQPFLVMDLIAGESLAERVERDGPLPSAEVARLGEKLARALQVAHDAGVLHRDLKPANVLVNEAGEPLLTDFGLAKLAGSEADLTKTGQVLGTPAYMPPEQATGARDRIDARSDVYGLGATLYDLLTGRPPFEGEHAMNLLVKIVREPPEPPSKVVPAVDRALERVVLRCLEKDPARRFQSSAELAQALAAWQVEHGAGPGSRASGGDHAPAPGGRAGSRALVLALGAGLLLALTGLGTTAAAARARGIASGHEAAAAALLAPWGDGAPVSADASREASLLLERALAADPGRPLARQLLARLAAESGDAARADTLVAGLPEDVLVAAGRLARGAGALARGDAAAAREELALARALGLRHPAVDARLAEATRADAQARGWRLAAEEAAWDVARARPESNDATDEALGAFVDGRLADRDLEGLARGWRHLHDALARAPASRDAPAPPYDELDTLDIAHAARLLGGWPGGEGGGPEGAASPGAARSAPARLRAALALALAPGADGVDALRAAGGAPGEGRAIREAARGALLLAGRAAPGAISTSASEWSAWAAAAERDPPSGACDGAGDALTLLERAHLLEAIDEAPLAGLLRDAAAPRLRAAAALALAVSATRDGGLPREQARARLASVARVGAGAGPAPGEDPGDPGLVARDALAALDALEGRAAPAAAANDGALRLALALSRLPGLARDLEDGARLHARLLEPGAPRALRAEVLVETGALAAAANALAGPDEAADLDAAVLAAQVALALGQEPAADPLARAGASDPARVRRAARRLAFTRRFGAVALAGPNDALRVVIPIDADRREAAARALVLEHGALGERPGALMAPRGLNARTRFAMRAVDHARADGGSVHPGDKVRLRLRAGWGTAELEGFLVEVVPGPGDHGHTIDRRGHAWAKAPGPFAFERSFEVWRDRARVSFACDGGLVGRWERPHAQGRRAGTVYFEGGWSGAWLSRLVVVGDWDEDAAMPTPPDAPALERWAGRLRPVPGDMPLLRERVPGAPADLGALRRDGVVLEARARWIAEDARRHQLVAATRLRGDFELRARLRLQAHDHTQQGGLALRDPRRSGDTLWLGVSLAPQEVRATHLLTFSGQRLAGWDMPLSPLPWTEGPEATAWLALRRVGDWVVPLAGKDERSLAPLPIGPVLFPLEVAPDACLYARSYSEAEPHARVGFDRIELLAPAP